jgi:lipoate-protein ligase A
LNEHIPYVTDINDLRVRLERYLSNDYHDTEVTLSNEQLEAVNTMAQQKFMTEAWTFHRVITRREKEMIRHAQRLACGMLEVQLQVEEGLITDCLLSGDFIGNLPPQHLEQALTGLRYDRDELYKTLSSMNIGNYFDGVTAADLLQLFFDN